MPAPEPELAPGFHGRPSPEPGLTYRLLRRGWRLAAFVLRARLELQGAEHLPVQADGRPAGRWIAACLPHRTWIDPFVPWILLPERPRLAFFGDARTMARSPLRRFVMARLGGVIPIPAGHEPRTAAIHFEAAARALDAGMVFCLMPETGPASELGRIRRLGSGVGYIALRNRVPIVPLVLGGNHELYLGRRVILRALPPLDPMTLAGLEPAIAGAAGTAVPAPGSDEEHHAVRRLLDALAAEVAAAVAEVHAEAEPPAGTPKRGRFLTTLFR
ncbi:MAG TPA: lysophospholipid acyltransferase family protein [Candidatus Limnocylindrales bacterium]|nr:lysophospholipid acyltransferase family protein [Candidatus Limnocylindrales bacterium]